MAGGKGVEKADPHRKVLDRRVAEPARAQRHAVLAVAGCLDAGLQRAATQRERLDQKSRQGRRELRDLGRLERHLRAQIGQRKTQHAGHLAPVHLQLAEGDARLVCKGRGRQEQRGGGETLHFASGRTPASRRLSPSSRPRPALVSARRLSPVE